VASGVAKRGANGQLPILFGDLPIVSFVNKLLPIEILYFQNCLFIFGLNTVCIFFLRSKSHMHSMLLLSVKN